MIESAPLVDPARPVTAAEFADAMAMLGPFERAPLLVVAVSGGPDSTALAHLAAEWAGARRGRVVAVVVDHRLRPDSGTEAEAVMAALQARGIAAMLRVRSGDVPASGLHERAREARYRLLVDAAVEIGALHLSTGHHADDQAETVRMRERRDSGPDGLAGMAACRELRGVRLLRPLLGFAKARLVATCRAQDLAFVADPSNVDPRYERSRLRGRVGEYAEPSVGVLEAEADRLFEACAAGLARSSRERRVAGWLAAHATVADDAAVGLDLAAWRDAEPWLQCAVMARAVATCGTLTYPPAPDALERLVSALHSDRFPRRTLGHCIVGRNARRIVIRSEPAANRRSLHASVEPTPTFAPVAFAPHVLASRHRSLMYQERGWAIRAQVGSDRSAQAEVASTVQDGPCHNEAPG